MFILYDVMLHKIRQSDKDALTQVDVSGGDYLITRGSEDVIFATGTGNVVLPDPFANGFFFVVNIGAGTVTLKDHLGATLATLLPEQGIRVASDGSTWFEVFSTTNNETDQLLLADSANENITTPLKTNQKDLNIDFVSAIGDRVKFSDVVDNLTSILTNVPLSANQGRVLNEKILAQMEQLFCQGVWDANTNTPDISAITTENYFWIVNVAGNTDIGGITDWSVGDWVINGAAGSRSRIDYSSVYNTESTPIVDIKENVDIASGNANQKTINIDNAARIREINQDRSQAIRGAMGSAFAEIELAAGDKGSFVPDTETELDFDLTTQSLNTNILTANESTDRCILGCDGMIVNWLFSMDYVIADAGSYTVSLKAYKVGAPDIQVGDTKTITLDGAEGLTGRAFFPSSLYLESDQNSSIYFTLECSGTSKVTMNEVNATVIVGDSINFNYGRLNTWRPDINFYEDDVTVYDKVLYVALSDVPASLLNDSPLIDTANWAILYAPDEAQAIHQICPDNDVTTINLIDKTVYQRCRIVFTLDYNTNIVDYEFVVGHDKSATVSDNGGEAMVWNGGYIGGVTMAFIISGNDVQLQITTSAVGGDISCVYRIIDKIPLAGT